MKYKPGEWFASMKADGKGFILWRQGPEGPVREGLIYREGTATELVKRMGEPDMAAIRATLRPLFRTAFGEIAEEMLEELLNKAKEAP
jgi:hypothetical protein